MKRIAVVLFVTAVASLALGMIGTFISAMEDSQDQYWASRGVHTHYSGRLPRIFQAPTLTVDR